MRRKKRWLRAAAIAAVMALLGVCLAIAWAHSDAARRFVEQEASARVGRTITLEDMEPAIDGFTLRGLSMSDPFTQDQPTFEAEHAVLELDWWALLGGSVEGSLEANDFELRVRKRGAQTNLHGLRRPSHASKALSLSLTLREGHVEYIDEDRHERIEAFGIELRSALRRSADAERGKRSADVELRVARLALLGLSIDDVYISLAAHEDQLAVNECVGTLQGGRVRASGALAFSEDSSWHADLELRDIGLEAHVRPLVAAFVPVLAGGGDDALGGTISLSAQFAGQGLQARAVSRSLQGRAQLDMVGVEFRPTGVWADAARSLSNTNVPWRLDELEIDAAVRRGWVHVEAVRRHGKPVVLPFRGRARVSGELELDVDVVALLGWVGDGAADWVQGYTTALEVSVRGSVASPELLGPRPTVLAAGVLGAWHRRARAPVPSVTP